MTPLLLEIMTNTSAEIKKPETFHHSHDTSGKKIARARFDNAPIQNPTRALASSTSVMSVAIQISAKSGPLIIDPILFTASSTVGAIEGT